MNGNKIAGYLLLIIGVLCFIGSFAPGAPAHCGGIWIVLIMIAAGLYLITRPEKKPPQKVVYRGDDDPDGLQAAERIRSNIRSDMADPTKTAEVQDALDHTKETAAKTLSEEKQEGKT